MIPISITMASPDTSTMVMIMLTTTDSVIPM